MILPSVKKDRLGTLSAPPFAPALFRKTQSQFRVAVVAVGPSNHYIRMPELQAVFQGKAFGESPFPPAYKHGVASKHALSADMKYTAPFVGVGDFLIERRKKHKINTELLAYAGGRSAGHAHSFPGYCLQ